MTKKMFLFLALTAVFTLSSCQKDNNTPEKIAEDFVVAVYSGDFEAAKLLVTEDSKKAIDFVAAFTTEKVEMMKSTDVGFESTEVTIAEDGLSATVIGNVLNSLDLETDQIVESKVEKINLVKVDEKWLVEYQIK